MEKSVTIPIEITSVDEGFHIFCKLKLGDSYIFSLIDTGASKSVISNELADGSENIRLMTMDRSMATGIGASSLDTRAAIIDEIDFGGVFVRDLLVGVIDFIHIDESYQKIGLDTFTFIIGGDILSSCKAEISYKDLTMTLFQADS